MTKVLVFDNYDSFTYNLVHMVEKMLHVKIDVFRNNEIHLEEIAKYDKIILSPGPGLPDEAGLLKPLIKEYASSKSILGVCLGHQAIAEVFGAKLINLDTVFHGVASSINIIDTNSKLYRNIEETQFVGRYHSWVVDPVGFPGSLTVTAFDENNNIMGLKHNSYDVQGMQFHPESVLTVCGEKIISNWLFD